MKKIQIQLGGMSRSDANEVANVLRDYVYGLIDEKIREHRQPCVIDGVCERQARKRLLEVLCEPLSIESDDERDLYEGNRG